ncbi:MAG: DNA polymerase III subunit delta [Lachnospiraceae bacterium]|nr:MAG: DNA polymerase III subunit delta [Lachnospiraceae bacterium]
MYRYSEALCQERIINYLKKIKAAGSISHAYIIQDEFSENAKTIAYAFAMSLHCQKGGVEACYNCHACKQILKNNHPDLIYVEAQNQKSISVGDIREKVNDTVEIKPYSSLYKVYIIDKADSMTVQAQNALLKTMEEPPEYAVIILIAQSLDRFLPTIKSRCIKLHISLISNQVILEKLRSLGIDSELSKSLASFSRGNLAKALTFSKEENINIYKENINILTNISSSNSMELYDYAELINTRENKMDFMDFCLMWYRDILLLSVNKNAENLIFKSEYRTLRKLTSVYSFSDLENITDSINHAIEELSSNVNSKYVIKLMLMQCAKQLK